MNNRILGAAALALCLSSASVAQDYTDAMRFNRNDLKGTARSQSMAGAFGALGADLTSMSINPAGMGVYRATELGLSLGVSVIKDESEYFKTKASDDRVRVPFDQIGASFTIGRIREEGGGLVSSTMFVGYNRLADYNNKQQYADPCAYNSLLDYFCFDSQKTALLTGDLAYNARLTNDTTGGFCYNVWEQYVGGDVNPNFRQDEKGRGLVDMRKSVKEDGSKGDISIGYAGNVANKFYFGGSVNLKTISYENRVTHREDFYGYTVDPNSPTSFSYRSRLEQDGTGVSFNLGVIYRPVSYFRVGFALHSPSFYSISERYSASIYNPALNKVFDANGEYDYRYRGPSRFIASAAGIFGRSGLISVDFERTNNARSKFRQKDEDDDITYDNPFAATNDLMKNEILCATNTLRIGGELSILSPIYLRAGYRFSTPGIKKDYYVNKPKNYACSGGIGFRFGNFFADVTYVCSVSKADSWVLPDAATSYFYEENAPAYLTQKTHSGIVTVGFRL